MKSYISVSSWRDRIRNGSKWEYIMYFLTLYVLLVFRTPKDFFQPYLWAEDGSVLIQQAIQNGLSSVFMVGNGTYWVMQKIVALICYWSVCPFRSIVLLPYIMQIVSKIIITLSVMYFISDRFEWLMPEKKYRFFICIGVVLLMSQNASDTLTCETAFPFPLFFVVYLIGLDLLCSSKVEMLNWKQTFFMTLLSLSSAEALCIGAIAVVIAIRYYAYKIRENKLQISQCCFDGIKLLLILSSVFLQTQCVLSGGRVSQQIEITKRIILNTKSFMFFPYWNQFHTWIAFFGGLLVWILIWSKSRISSFILIYSAGFSYLAMLYNCMAESEAYSGVMTSRYVFICFEIAAFMLGIAICKLIKNPDKESRALAYICLLCAIIVSLRTYDVPVIGYEYADCYKSSSVVFDKNGKDVVIIPVGPWKPWTCEIPANIRANKMEEDLEIGIESIDGKMIGDSDFGLLTSDDNWELIGWVKSSKDNEVLKNLFIKEAAIYIAAESIDVRAVFDGQKLSHNGYRFNLTKGYDVLKEGVDALEFVGQTEDGVWHSGRVTVEIKK